MSRPTCKIFTKENLQVLAKKNVHVGPFGKWQPQLQLIREIFFLKVRGTVR